MIHKNYTALEWSVNILTGGLKHASQVTHMRYVSKYEMTQSGFRNYLFRGASAD